VKAAKAGDWKAGAWLYERVYGKPTERVEVETPGTLAEIQAMTPEERIALRRRMLAQYPGCASSSRGLSEGRSAAC
jgi:hypothetical protein